MDMQMFFEWAWSFVMNVSDLMSWLITPVSILGYNVAPIYLISGSMLLVGIVRAIIGLVQEGFMVDIIYDFIRNSLIGENSTLSGADNLALLLTWAVIIGIAFVLIRLVVWAFYFPLKRRKKYRS